MEIHSDVSRFLFFTLNVFLLLNQVSAYYCNHDLCREDQYCCGDNLCCDYVYSPWYFWAGVVFMVLVLSACGGLFRYCYDSNSYVVLHSSKEEYYASKGAMDEDKGLTGVLVNREAPPPYSVAQYSDTPENYQRFPFYEEEKHRPNL
ncbi:uncharacterized protein LOC129983870 [Argiope bruennichi]|uniref:Vesicular, overexpressed in cancer, prosurvival protein 1 n=1 Tax=Argiope bruennichi TaxID=94029 RepID=A0A8T0EL78_ARGBR|nr:uncharacterized protein LOC129983870 [Argiope bruennichi]KAF8774657.1 hypothetical protein HNY73_017186 [Argiope bruennichi]